MHISANTREGQHTCMHTSVSACSLKRRFWKSQAYAEGEMRTASLALRGLVLDQSRVRPSIVKNLRLDVRTPPCFPAQAMCNLRAARAQFMNKLFDAESPKGV